MQPRGPQFHSQATAWRGGVREGHGQRVDGGPHHDEGCAYKSQVQFEAWGCECRAANGSRERSWWGRKPQARGAGQTQTCALTSRAALGGCCGSITTWHLQWHHKEGPRRGQGKEPWTPEGQPLRTHAFFPWRALTPVFWALDQYDQHKPPLRSPGWPLLLSPLGFSFPCPTLHCCGSLGTLG